MKEAIVKKIAFLLAISLLIFAGCQSPSSAAAPSVDDTNASFDAVGTAIGSVMSTTPTQQTSGNVMTMTYTGTNAVAVMSLDLVTGAFSENVTLTNCVSSPYTISGTVSASGTINLTTYQQLSIHMTGSLTLSGGPITTLTCDFTGTYNAGTSQMDLTGTITANGHVFDVSELNINM